MRDAWLGGSARTVYRPGFRPTISNQPSASVTACSRLPWPSAMTITFGMAVGTRSKLVWVGRGGTSKLVTRPKMRGRTLPDFSSRSNTRAPSPYRRRVVTGGTPLYVQVENILPIAGSHKFSAAKNHWFSDLIPPAEINPWQSPHPVIRLTTAPTSKFPAGLTLDTGPVHSDDSHLPSR